MGGRPDHRLVPTLFRPSPTTSDPSEPCGDYQRGWGLVKQKRRMINRDISMTTTVRYSKIFFSLHTRGMRDRLYLEGISRSGLPERMT
jgi:hypothetical protein